MWGIIVKIPELLLAIVIAACGGFSGFLMDEKHSWFDLIVSLFTAGFAGFLTFHFCQELGYSKNMTSILCGVAGLGGKNLLLIIKKYTLKYAEKKGEKL